MYTQLWDRELNCAHSYGTEGTEIVHVTGQTDGTGIVYTAMGQELNCTHSYGTEGTGIEGTGIMHVTGWTEGTGIVYTAMGQGAQLCT